MIQARQPTGFTEIKQDSSVEDRTRKGGDGQGRKVVIKSLKEKHLARPESVRKFIAEAKLNAQLDHPAIVPLYSLDTDSADGLHLAMQLIDGITLKEYLKRCRERMREEPPRNRRYERSLQCRVLSWNRSFGNFAFPAVRGLR